MESATTAKEAQELARNASPHMTMNVSGLSSVRPRTVLAIQDGERESHLSWLHLLQDLKVRGLKDHAFLAVADGALGFWKALEEALPSARTQQCWVHKTANVLDKLSLRVCPDAKRLLLEMYLSPPERMPWEPMIAFSSSTRIATPRACQCLRKDRDVMFTFYDFPAAHWVHLRTTNPIESTFATGGVTACRGSLSNPGRGSETPGGWAAGSD